MTWDDGVVVYLSFFLFAKANAAFDSAVHLQSYFDSQLTRTFGMTLDEGLVMRKSSYGLLQDSTAMLWYYTIDFCDTHTPFRTFVEPPCIQPVFSARCL